MAAERVCIFGDGPGGWSAADSLLKRKVAVTLVRPASPYGYRPVYTREDQRTLQYDLTPVNGLRVVTPEVDFVLPGCGKYGAVNTARQVSTWGKSIGPKVEEIRLGLKELERVAVVEVGDGVVVRLPGADERKYDAVVDATGVGAEIISKTDLRQGSGNYMLTAVYCGTYRGEADDALWQAFPCDGALPWISPSALGAGLVDVVYSRVCWKTDIPHFIEIAPAKLAEAIRWFKTKGLVLHSDKPEEVCSGQIRLQPTSCPKRTNYVYAIGEAAGMADPATGDSWRRALMAGVFVAEEITKGGSPAHFYRHWRRVWALDDMHFGLMYTRALHNLNTGIGGQHVSWFGERILAGKVPKSFIEDLERYLVEGKASLLFYLYLTQNPNLGILALKALTVQLRMMLGGGYSAIKPLNGCVSRATMSPMTS